MSQLEGTCEVVYLDEVGDEQRCDLRNAGGVPFHKYQHPVRKPAAYRAQKHLSGHYFFSSSHKLILYESRLEMTSLMRMDFEPKVVEVAAQPFRLVYERDGKKRSHVPDYFAKLEDGRELVVDVKPSAFANRPRNQEIFRTTNKICRQAGWLYKVDVGLAEPHLSSIKWLAGFRRVPPVSKFKDYADAIVDSCSEEPKTVLELLEELGSPASVRPVLFHLLWKQIVILPMDKPLGLQSRVSLPDRGRRLEYVENS